MESVMNFLADYYVWFFVAAIVLCFALIGFVIESKKKQKSEFKGESIENDNSAVSNINIVEENVVPVNNVNPINEGVQVTENLSSPSAQLPVNENVTLEETMNISNVPLTSEMNVPKAEPIEFYNGPIEMPVNNVEDNTVINNDSLEYVNEIKPEINATIGEAISYNDLSNNQNSSQYNSVNQNTLEQSNVQESQEKPEDFNIFDNLK